MYKQNIQCTVHIKEYSCITTGCRQMSPTNSVRCKECSGAFFKSAVNKKVSPPPLVYPVVIQKCSFYTQPLLHSHQVEPMYFALSNQHRAPSVVL